MADTAGTTTTRSPPAVRITPIKDGVRQKSKIVTLPESSRDVVEKSMANKTASKRGGSSQPAPKQETRHEDRPIATVDDPVVQTTRTSNEPVITSTLYRDGKVPVTTLVSAPEGTTLDTKGEYRAYRRANPTSVTSRMAEFSDRQSFQTLRSGSKTREIVEPVGSFALGWAAIPIGIGETLRTQPSELIRAPARLAIRAVTKPGEVGQELGQKLRTQPAFTAGQVAGSVATGRVIGRVTSKIPIKRYKAVAKDRLRIAQEKVATQAEGVRFEAGVKVKTFKYVPLKKSGEFTFGKAGEITGRQTRLKPLDDVSSAIQSGAARYRPAQLSTERMSFKPAPETQYLGKFAKRPLSPSQVQAVRDPRGAVLTPRGELKPFLKSPVKKSVQLEVTDFSQKKHTTSFKDIPLSRSYYLKRRKLFSNKKGQLKVQPEFRRVYPEEHIEGESFKAQRSFEVARPTSSLESQTFRPITKTTSRTVPLSAVRTRDNLKPVTVVRPKSALKPMAGTLQTPKVVPKLTPATKAVPKSAQRQKQKAVPKLTPKTAAETSLVTPTVPGGKLTTRPVQPPQPPAKPPTPPYLTSPKKKKKKKKKEKKKKFLEPKLRYAPQLFSVVAGVKTSKPFNIKGLTGVGLRPILK